MTRGHSMATTPAALLFAAALCAATPAAPAAAADAGPAPAHGYSPVHELKYGPDFRHFDYVDPAAAKGGTIRFGLVGTYDSLNLLRYPGQTPRDTTGTVRFASLVFDSLLAPSADEPAGYYGLLAESVEVAPDTSWARFRIDPRARWHDGRPVTAGDVVFTVDTLREQGAPFYRLVLRQIAAEAESERSVLFRAARPHDREFVATVGQIPIHPRHHWAGRDVGRTTLAPPLGSGPYRIVEADAGRSLVLARVADYWAAAHPVNVGRFNFDRIRVDFYRDDTAALEAFKAGRFDVRVETSAVRWASGYDSPALADGRIARAAIERADPGSMALLAFNLRRPAFRDLRVRQAIALAYDFEWTNRILFHGEYRPVGSHYGETELAARGPAEGGERAILKPVADQLPSGLFAAAGPDEGRRPPPLRAALGEAAALLDAAGFELRDGRRIDPATGQPMSLSALYVNPALTRVLAPVAQNLKRLGIELRYPLLEGTTAQKKMLERDFDLAVLDWSPSLAAGTSERLLWHSAFADRDGSYAIAGAKDAALDHTIAALTDARTWEELQAAARAFDRVLRWRVYTVPLWRSATIRIARRETFGEPAAGPAHLSAAHELIERWWWRGGSAPERPAREEVRGDAVRPAL